MTTGGFNNNSKLEDSILPFNDKPLDSVTFKYPYLFLHVKNIYKIQISRKRTTTKPGKLEKSSSEKERL